MAVHQSESRVVCPFCLSIFTIPTNTVLVEQQKLNVDGHCHSRLRIIDEKVYWLGLYTNYHMHQCRGYHCTINVDKLQLIPLSPFLMIPLKHSTLIVIPITINMIQCVCNPSNYLIWSSHRSWNYRVLHLVFNAIKLQSLMAWCNTIGGAHSSLGDSHSHHAEKAGFVSVNQLALSHQMGDHMLQSKSRLFIAFSFLQKRKLSQAKKLIKSEYISLMKAKDKDQKLINMCLSAWNRYKAMTQANKT